jgi:hypothetical protein
MYTITRTYFGGVYSQSTIELETESYEEAKTRFEKVMKDALREHKNDVFLAPWVALDGIGQELDSFDIDFGCEHECYSLERE